jgi:hypothetical protein
VRALKSSSILPVSFRDALKTRWKVVKEESTTNTDKTERSGVVLLSRKDVATRLRIAYTATAKDWTFATPQPIEETIAA